MKKYQLKNKMFSKILQTILLKMQKKYAFMTPAKFAVHLLCMFHYYFIILFNFYLCFILLCNYAQKEPRSVKTSLNDEVLKNIYLHTLNL